MTISSDNVSNTLNEMESLIVDESSIFLINATVIRSSITTTSDNSTRLSLPISSAITISSNNLSNTLNEMESLIVDESSRYLIIFVDITSSIVITSCRDFRDTSISTVSAMARESTLVPSVSLTNTLNEMESLIVDESSRYLIIFVDITSSIVITSKSGFLEVNANTVSDVVNESTLVPSTSVT